MARKIPPSRSKVDTSQNAWWREFAHWWARELSWFVPDALKERGLPSARLLWLEVTSGAAVFRRLRGGKSHEVGRVDLSANDPLAEKIAFDKLIARIGSQPVGVGVMSAQVLKKRMALPLAARENIGQVMGFEIDRQTPYQADQIYFHWREAGMESGNVLIDLAVLPRHAVESALGRVKEWGLDLHGIAVLNELDGGSGYVNFLPEVLRPATGRAWTWIYSLMAVVTLSILFLMLAIPVWQKREVAAELLPELTKFEREAKAVAALKNELNAALGWHNYLIERRLTTHPKVAVLEELTRFLPNNTWVQSLEVGDQEVLIQGETGASSGLVGLFAKSKLLGEANHKSPLVKVHDNLERFQLSVALLPVTLEDALRTQSALKKTKPDQEKTKLQKSKMKTKMTKGTV